MHDAQDLRSVIEGCVSGDRVSQKKIYELYYGKMMGVCMRYTKDTDRAQDILQDALIKVFANIGKYDFKGSFEGWVRRIVVNTAIDFFRRSKKDFMLLGENQSIEEYSEELDDEDDSEDKYDFEPQEIMDAMQKLSPAYRVIFNMYVFENLTHKEIAEKLEISVGTSKSNFSKAKKNIQRLLLKH